jgi:large subunit ribosomal protein L21
LEDALYAVVKTGGKQYRVQEGRALTIERLPGDAGDTVELGDVLLMGEGSDITVGAPTIPGARVLGTIEEQGRAKKILVFHFKNKTRHRKKNGHRQQFTRLVVSDILAAGQQPKPKQAAAAPVAEAEVEAPKAKRARKVAPADEATAPATEAAVDAPAAEEKPKRTRKKAE